MTEYTLPHFGQVNLTALEEDYRTKIEFNGNEIRLDINFQNKNISQTKMDIVRNFIENIGDFDKQNKVYIDNDYKDENGDIVKEYLEFHIEELEKDELSKLIDFENKTIDEEKQLLAKLKLERVGLYPDGKYGAEYFAVFDYTLEGNIYIDGRRTITDQIIVVNTNELGKLDHLSWES